MKQKVKKYFSWMWVFTLVGMVILSFNLGAYSNIKPGAGHFLIFGIVCFLGGASLTAGVLAVIELVLSNRNRKPKYTVRNKHNKKKKHNLPPMMKRMEGVVSEPRRNLGGSVEGEGEIT